MNKADIDHRLRVRLVEHRYSELDDETKMRVQISMANLEHGIKARAERNGRSAWISNVGTKELAYALGVFLNGD